MQLAVEGQTAAQLFEKTARTLTQALLPECEGGSALREKFVAEADNLPALLNHWVQTLLKCFYDERMAFYHFAILPLGPSFWRLEVEATGELLDIQRVQQAPQFLFQSIHFLKTEPYLIHLLLELQRPV